MRHPFLDRRLVEYVLAVPGEQLYRVDSTKSLLRHAMTGLLPAFMAGMAANVSSLNTVFTYDLWQDWLRPGRDDRYYLQVGRSRIIDSPLTVFIEWLYEQYRARPIDDHGQTFEASGTR